MGGIELGGGLSGTKMDYAMDWPIVPKTWPLKIGITISREKVLVLEYAIFQLRKKKEACMPCCGLSSIWTLSNP